MIIEAMKSSASAEFKGKISKEAIKGYQAMVLNGYTLKLGGKPVSVERFIEDELVYRTKLVQDLADALCNGVSRNVLSDAINRYTYDAIEEYCVENDIEIE